MTAAYRLFDNEKVQFENVLQPHIDATHRRIADQPVAILAQDTTEIDLTRPEQLVDGAGPLDGAVATRRVPASVARLHAGRDTVGDGTCDRLGS